MHTFPGPMRPIRKAHMVRFRPTEPKRLNPRRLPFASLLPPPLLPSAAAATLRSLSGFEVCSWLIPLEPSLIPFQFSSLSRLILSDFESSAIAISNVDLMKLQIQLGIGSNCRCALIGRSLTELAKTLSSQIS